MALTSLEFGDLRGSLDLGNLENLWLPSQTQKRNMKKEQVQSIINSLQSLDQDLCCQLKVFESIWKTFQNEIHLSNHVGLVAVSFTVQIFNIVRKGMSAGHFLGEWLCENKGCYDIASNNLIANVWEECCVSVMIVIALCKSKVVTFAIPLKTKIRMLASVVYLRDFEGTVTFFDLGQAGLERKGIFDAEHQMGVCMSSILEEFVEYVNSCNPALVEKVLHIDDDEFGDRSEYYSILKMKQYNLLMHCFTYRCGKIFREKVRNKTIFNQTKFP